MWSRCFSRMHPWREENSRFIKLKCSLALIIHMIRKHSLNQFFMLFSHIISISQSKHLHGSLFQTKSNNFPMKIYRIRVFKFITNLLCLFKCLLITKRISKSKICCFAFFIGKMMMESYAEPLSGTLFSSYISRYSFPFLWACWKNSVNWF